MADDARMTVQIRFPIGTQGDRSVQRPELRAIKGRARYRARDMRGLPIQFLGFQVHRGWVALLRMCRELRLRASTE